MRLAVLPLLALVVAAAPAGHSQDDFTFETRDLRSDVYFPTYLANGFFSCQSTLRGTDPALSLVAGCLERTTDDVPRPAAVPAWNQVDIWNGRHWLNSQPLDGAHFADYRQTLDAYRGELTTAYRWVDGDRTLSVRIVALVSQADPNLAAVVVTIVPTFGGEITVQAGLQEWPAPRARLPLARLDLQATRRAVEDVYGLPHADSGLLSQILRPPTPTAANRELLWYPGECRVTGKENFAAAGSARLQASTPGGPLVHEALELAAPSGWRCAEAPAPSGVALRVSGRVDAGHTYAVTKFVAVAADREGDPGVDVRALAALARKEGFAALRGRHEAAWAALWRSDIRVEGDPALQRVIHADLFYLYENCRLDGDLPISACGFSPNYYGHVFWDNDTWDFPVLLLLHPERAAGLERFRRKTLAVAQHRAQQRHLRGAMYPWEADPATGEETTPRFAEENAEREIHVTADVALALWQYYLATGDEGWLRDAAFPVLAATADFWVSRATWNAATRAWDIDDVTSPDEAYTHVRNDAFTNEAARKNLLAAAAAAAELRRAPDPRWSAVARDLARPYSPALGRHLDFDPALRHDKHTWMGSALPFLALPSVDVSMPLALRRRDFAYAVEALRTLSPDANEMLVVILALEAETSGDAAASARWLFADLQGFVKPPYFVRSETPRNNTTWILATSAGFLQNFLFGCTGLRLDAAGLTPVYPAVLPPPLTGIRLSGVTLRGRRYTVTVRPDAAGAATRLIPEPAR